MNSLTLQNHTNKRNSAEEMIALINFRESGNNDLAIYYTSLSDSHIPSIPNPSLSITYFVTTMKQTDTFNFERNRYCLINKHELALAYLANAMSRNGSSSLNTHPDNLHITHLALATMKKSYSHLITGCYVLPKNINDADKRLIAEFLSLNHFKPIAEVSNGA